MMIDLAKYCSDNSIKYSKWNSIPKRYVAAFALLHKGEKTTAIWKALSDLYHSNGTHKSAFDKFFQETFVLNGKGKILELKDSYYFDMELVEEYPFSKSLMNGIKVIEQVLGLDSFYDVDEQTMKMMLNTRFEDVLAVSNVVNCGINQNVFDYVIARECLLNQKTIKYADIADLFFSLLIYGGLFSKLVDNVREDQKNECLMAIRSLSLSNYNPRFELNSIDELKSFDINKLFFYYGFNISVLVKLLNYYSEKSEDVIPQLFVNYINTLDPVIRDVLTRRETETLDAIGKSYNLTRERIRQKERDGMQDFHDFYVENLTSGDKNMIFIFPKISYVFPIDSFKGVLGEANDCFINLMKYNEYVGGAKYCKELNAVVESDQVIELFKSTANEVFGDYFKKTDMNSKVDEILESLKDYGFDLNTIQTYISCAYKDKGSLYVKNHIKFTREYQVNQILFEYFDNGFAASNDDDVIQMNQYAVEMFGAPIFDENEYGEKSEEAKKQAGVKNKQRNNNVKAVVDRCKVRQIDRGTYIHESKAVDLSIELMEKIITYLNLKNRALAYSNILETFKEELEEVGITNRYELQGAMSKYKGELFNSDRDYVTPINIQQTLRDSMVSWIDSQTGLFTYDDFKKEFKGVATSVFMSAIYDYKETAYYWQQGYITLKALNVSEEAKNKLKQYLSTVITQYHLNYCSADEIFNFVKIQMPAFISETKMKYSYDLFSVLELLFGSEFKFKRPLIGNKNSEFESGAETLSKYLESKILVRLSSLRRFLDSKIVSRYYTIHEILEEKHNEFVVTDQDTMVRKERFEITEKELIRLDVVLEMLLEEKEQIDIQEDIVDKCYFTEIAKIKCNRYLVFGVINTFFHDKYVIKLETPIFRNGQFTVKKK